MDKHSTHSLCFIEYVVARNKVVSARKAHVQMPKVERFRWKEGKDSARRPPILPRGEHVLVYFYVGRQSTCLSSFSPTWYATVLAIVFLIPWQFTLLGGWA